MENLGVMSLPTEHSKNSVENIIKENFKEYQMKITSATNPGENFLGLICRIEVTGIDKNGKKNSMSLILKKAEFEDKTRELLFINKMYQRENLTYSTILPAFNKLQEQYNIPKNEQFRFAKWYLGSDKPSEEFIILDDLRVEGFKMYDRFKPMDRDHMTLFIKSLAKLHACSFVYKKKYPDEFYKLMRHSSNFESYGQIIQTFAKLNRNTVINAITDENLRKKAEKTFQNITEELNKYYKPDAAYPYSVFCHGDCWCNNALFKYKDGKVCEITQLDWQFMKYNSPITDLAYLMFVGSDRKTRTLYYKDMLDVYYKTMSTHISMMGHKIEELYPEKIYKEHLKIYMACGIKLSFFIVPFTLGDKDKPIDVDEMFAVSDEKLSEIYTLPKLVENTLIELIEDGYNYGIL